MQNKLNQILEKFDKINLTVLNPEILKEIREIEEQTDNFQDEEIAEAYFQNFMDLYDLIETQYPEALQAFTSGKKKEFTPKSRGKDPLDKINMNESIITQPKLSFADFKRWYGKIPVHEKVKIETVTARDLSWLTDNDKKTLAKYGSSRLKVTMKEIYNEWYLARLIAPNKLPEGKKKEFTPKSRGKAKPVMKVSHKKEFTPKSRGKVDKFNYLKNLTFKELHKRLNVVQNIISENNKTDKKNSTAHQIKVAEKLYINKEIQEREAKDPWQVSHTKEFTPRSRGKKPVKKETRSSKVASMPEDLRLIKRFAAFNNRTVKPADLLRFITSLQKAIAEKKITNNKPVLRKIQTRAVNFYNQMMDLNLKEVKVEMEEDLQSDIEKAIKEVNLYASVPFIKRYIALTGSDNPDFKRIQTLKNSLSKAVSSGAIDKSDIYINEIENILAKLTEYINDTKKTFRVAERELEGLAGIAGIAYTPKKKPEVKKDHPKPAKNEPVKSENNLPSDLEGLFSPINKPAENRTPSKVIILPGEIGTFLGAVERLEYAIVIRGDKGAGKTRLLYQVMNSFAEAGFTIANFSLEIHKDSDLVRQMKNEYISKNNLDKIQIAGEAPHGIDTIRKAAEYFDVVAIDSFSKLNASQKEFDRLRKQYPHTFFITVFQSTTNGTARGGSMAEYDAQAVIQVDRPFPDKLGYALTEKNRYAKENFVFDVDKKKAITYDEYQDIIRPPKKEKEKTEVEVEVEIDKKNPDKIEVEVEISK